MSLNQIPLFVIVKSLFILLPNFDSILRIFSSEKAEKLSNTVRYARPMTQTTANSPLTICIVEIPATFMDVNSSLEFMVAKNKMDDKKAVNGKKLETVTTEYRVVKVIIVLYEIAV